jgi:hypothetical protein
MGDKEALIQIVVGSRKALEDAKDVAHRTQRPVNACPAHDAQFSLAMALSGGVDTLLMLQEQHLIGSIKAGSDDATSVPATVPARGLAALLPFRWPIALVVSVALLIMGGERVYKLLADRLNEQQFSMTGGMK